MFSALFDWLLGAGREAAVFIISMVPLVELRGAVPLGAAAGIPWTTLFPLAILGNMLPIPLLLVFGEKLLAWAETLPPLRKFAAAYKKKLLSKSGEVTKYARLGLYLFVAVPLPGTGAWSGALIAAENAQNARAAVYFLRRHHGGHHHADRVSRRARRGKDDINERKKALSFVRECLLR